MEQHLMTLLIRLGVVASLASFLARSKTLKRALMREDRTLPQRLQLALWLSTVFAASVAIRVTSTSYDAVDLGLEGSLIAGLLGGYMSGLVAGPLIALPAMLHQEWLSLPLFAGIGVMGGLVRDIAIDKEDIWRFSPFFDLNLYRAFRYGKNLPRALFPIFFFSSILLAEFLRQTLGHFFPGRIFTLYPTWPNPNAASIAALYASTFFAVTLPLKVWSNMRNEIKLEEQERLLMESRLQALTSQINPHFLFNTLNSVSSLIRTDPHRARLMIVKLSKILRKLLGKHDPLTTLRAELEFVDDYLAIEMIRFGEKLRFERDVDPLTLEMRVPSMILQPLIENCLKHGISSKVEGGTIRLETRLREGRMQLMIADDGVGIPEHKQAKMLEGGIGVSNVNERLKVLFGSAYRMWIDSQPGRGTRITIELPEAALNGVAAEAAVSVR